MIQCILSSSWAEYMLVKVWHDFFEVGFVKVPSDDGGSVRVLVSSSSSSSPLLSLVQVPAKLAINLSIHTQHTYDNGVDRTGDRVFRKIQLLHEEREEEKIF